MIATLVALVVRDAAGICRVLHQHRSLSAYRQVVG